MTQRSKTHVYPNTIAVFEVLSTVQQGIPLHRAATLNFVIESTDYTAQKLSLDALANID